MNENKITRKSKRNHDY